MILIKMTSVRKRRNDQQSKPTIMIAKCAYVSFVLVIANPFVSSTAKAMDNNSAAVATEIVPD